MTSAVRMTARALMAPLERADRARCWFGMLLGPQEQCPNRGVSHKPADAFFAFTQWLNGARWCEVHRHAYDVEVDQGPGSAAADARAVRGGGRVVGLKGCSRWQTDPRWPSGI
jgi:hypothetical protein